MQPNIIFLHAHNTGRFIQPYGHAVPTPNIQRLAGEGVLFRKAFSAAPSCSPSRASFLTGQHPHTAGMLGLAHRGFALFDPERHIARTLSRHGYESVLCGIEHTAAFKVGIADGVGYDRVLTRDSAEAADVAPLVIDYLKQTPSHPFFMSVGLTETHTPYPAAEPETHSAEDARYVIPPRPFPDSPKLRMMAADFKHSARRMDDAWGAILDALDETGLAEKTVVFCFTDHGLQWPLHIANVGEHGNAAYLVIRGRAELSGGKVIDEMVSLMDLFPTVCDLVGLDAPDWLQGRSLLPLVSNDVERLHEQLFFEQTYHAAYEPMRAVRSERYIYIKRFDDRDRLVLPNTDNTPAKEALLGADWRNEPRTQEMLYDVYFDPDQQNNLIDEPSKQAVAEEMRTALARWMQETDDPLLHGPVPLPPGVMSTDPDAFSPDEEPMLIGDR